MSKEYYNTKEKVKEYIQMAKDVDGRLLIDKLKMHLEANSVLLEIGSGPGSDWKILNEFYEVIGSDNSVEFLKYLRTKYPKENFLELNAISLETDLVFDGIYSNKVLHHLSDQELKDSIEKQHNILKANGIICHSFWKGEGSEEFKGMFVNYHTEIKLKGILNDYFEITLIESYKEFDEDDSLLLIAKKI